MSLYPPLTEANLLEINRALEEIRLLREEVASTVMNIVSAPGDEDDLLREVSDFRAKISALDTAVFKMYGLVHCLKESNVPTTVQLSRRPHPTLDTLEDMLS